MTESDTTEAENHPHPSLPLDGEGGVRVISYK